MKKKIVLIPLALLLAISLVAIACAPPVTPTPTPTPTPAPAPAPAPTPTPVPEAEVIIWKLQSASPAGEPGVMFMNDLGASILAMSGGRLRIDILPAGAVVPAKELGVAVDQRVLDAGHTWTHYQIGKNPAAALFSSPPAGAGTGFDLTSWLAWYMFGGGQALYEELYTDIFKQDIVPFVLSPLNPQMLGWFKEPIETMEEFKKLKYRVSSGLATDVYVEMGASPVSMSGAELVPALERGVLDAAEWISPAGDIEIGLQDVLKYISLGGLHQVTVLQEIIINGEAWRELPADLQAIVDEAIKAQYATTQAWYLHADAVALEELTTVHGVTIFPVPPGYVEEFIAATERVMAKLSAEYPFFKEVLDSQMAFAKLVVPMETEINQIYASMGAAAGF